MATNVSKANRQDVAQQQSRAAAERERAFVQPPVDIIETADAVVVYVALPGVPANAIEVVFDPDGITVSGERRFPARRAVRLHRIEIPSGRFQRRILLPLHALEPAMPQLADGSLAITLTKVKESL